MLFPCQNVEFMNPLQNITVKYGLFMYEVVSQPNRCAPLRHNVWGCYHIKIIGCFDSYASLWAWILGLRKQLSRSENTQMSQSHSHVHLCHLAQTYPNSTKISKMDRKKWKFIPLLSHAETLQAYTPGATHIYWCTYAWTKKQVKRGLFFFCSRTRKARNAFRSLNTMFQEKECCFVKICSNSLDSNLFRGQIWDKILKNTCLGGEFCIMTKI